MSRLKGFAVGTALTVTLLGGAIALWYQSRYVAPLTPRPAQALPTPNGFLTLQDAMRLRKGPLHGVPVTRWKIGPLAERQKLLAENQPFLAKTREALTQQYLIPSGSPATHTNFLFSHMGELLFSAKTYSDSRNAPEAMRCGLDALELGVIVPRGGTLQARNAALYYEGSGQQVVWKMTPWVDAKTARKAATRLTQRETWRWPISENLREDLRNYGVASKLAEFQVGPAYAWEKQASDQTGEARKQEHANAGGLAMLWSQAQVVYGGPKALVNAAEGCVKQARARLDAPWQPNRPRLRIDLPVSPSIADTYSALEGRDYFLRTQSALLRTHLALRAYSLEQGSYPKSLDTLVLAGYLKTIPTDPFSPTRAPLRYRLSGKTFALWSVGPDATDNGGQAPVANQKPETGRGFDVVGGNYSLVNVNKL